MSTRRGRLIVFEGVEGAGKSTQIERLAAVIGRSGATCRTFREPGGTAAGDTIRALLLDPASQLSSSTEALLFMASRAELVVHEVRPALAAGDIVLLDRFFLSTYAYQVAGRGLSETDVRTINRMATGDLIPDLTILLRLAARDGLARAERRGSADRMEQSGDAFHARVEGAFTEFASEAWQATHLECGPIVSIDARGTEAEVTARVLDAVAQHMAELRTPHGAVA